MASEQNVEFLKKLTDCNEHYKQIYQMLAPNEFDDAMPPPIKLMKDFAFKDLLTSSAHFRSYISLIEESIRIKEEYDKKQEETKSDNTSVNYNVNITDTPVEASEKI